MSTTPTEPTTETPEPTPAQPEATAPSAPAQEPDWKAEARKWEQRAKDNKNAADKLAAIEEAAKTDLEKANDRAAKAEAARIEAERKAFAALKGIPANLITGNTEEEWQSAAEAALAWRGEVPKPPAAPSAAGQGKQGEPIGATPGGAQVTEAELATMTPQQIETARKAGRLNQLLGVTT